MAILCSAFIASTFVVAPAYADTATVTPTVDGNNGYGETEMVVKIQDKTERGGTKYNDSTKEYYNPDRGDGYGKNIAFSVPIKINFTIDSTGKLNAPSADKVFIENHGKSKIHASSLMATEAADWHIVADANASNLTGASADTQNNVDIQIMPQSSNTGKIELVNYKTKNTLPTTTTWNMDSGIDSTSVVTDRVQMKIEGDVSRVMKDVTTNDGAKFCTLTWYMTNGSNA